MEFESKTVRGASDKRDVEACTITEEDFSDEENFDKLGLCEFEDF